MATKTLTLTSDGIRTFYKKTQNGAYTYSEYTGTEDRVGTASSGSAKYGAFQYHIFADFSSLWTDDIASGTVSGVVLTIRARNSSGNYEDDLPVEKELIARAFAGVSLGNSDAEIKYEAANMGVDVGSVFEIAGSGADQVVQRTVSGDALKNLLAYKTIGIVPEYDVEIDNSHEWYVIVSSISLEITYSSAQTPPIVSNLTVSSEFAENGLVSYGDPLMLSWDYTQDSGLTQAYIDVEIRMGTGDWVAIASRYATAASTYMISSARYPAPYDVGNALYIRMRAYSSAGASSEWVTAGMALIFPEASGQIPAGGSVILAGESAELSWEVVCRYNDIELTMWYEPTEYDIQYSADAGETWTVIGASTKVSKTNGRYRYVVPADTFPSGIILWRVRPRINGYSLDRWSQETFTAKVQASTSSVTCDGRPHPTISWSSASQIAYQVRFADYDSGAVYGTATSHKIPYVYADGVYPVQARTQASDGVWSGWTDTEYVTIRNTTPAGSLTLTAGKTQNAVSLSWSGTAFGTYILYRDDIPIYVGNRTSYTDQGAYGVCVYFVRGMTEPNYLQSNTLRVQANPASDCMYDITAQRWIPLRYSSSRRARSYTEAVNAAYGRYAGRTYPVAFVDGSRDRQVSVSYCFKSISDADRVRDALGHTVIYKDTKGRRVVGLFSQMAEIVTGRFEHQITIVQLDYSEEVRYEA